MQIADYKEIKRLKKTQTYKEVGDKFGVSGQYIYEILQKNKLKYCKKHRRVYSGDCIMCEITHKFKKEISKKKTLEQLLPHINRLSLKIRKREAVIQRQILIKYLRDKLKLSYPQLGILFKRHHTTIMHYYNRAKKI